MPGRVLLERLLALAARPSRQTTEIEALEGELSDLGDSAHGSWTSGRQPFEELYEVFVLLYEERKRPTNRVWTFLALTRS